MRSIAISTSLCFVSVVGACSKPSPPPLSEAEQEAHQMFETKCAVCHGLGGAGNGPSAEAFEPRPHDYTDPGWQASVSDDQIKQIILRGGANLGKNPAMPSNIFLRERPEVLDGFVTLIRGFGKRP